MKRIRDLFDVDSDDIVLGITDDSREVEKGFVFVATHGYNVDHYDYIQNAIEKGCIFLVVDREIPFSFPHVIVENVDEAYHDLCIKFYDIDLSKLHFIGIFEIFTFINKYT